MNFFRRRPLALALAICMLMSAAASLLPSDLRMVLLIVTAVLIPVLLLIFRLRPTGHIAGIRPSEFVLLAGVISILMIVSVFIYEARAEKFRTLAADSEMADSAYQIEATIIEVNYESSFGAAYTVRMRSLDGEPVNEKGLLFGDAAMGLAAGDIISGEVTFSPLGEVYSMYDMTEGRMMSSGWYFACELTDGFEYVGQTGGIEVMFARLRERLGASLTLYLDKDSSGLAKALLLGERDELGIIERDFRRIGAAHLLALSGLHLSLLCLMLDELLILFQIGRIGRIAIEIPLIYCFLALIGFPYSAVRAGIMLTIVRIAFIFKGGHDNITNLFIAGGLILLFDPPALYDIGFAMSFFGTLGVLLFSVDAMRFLKPKFVWLIHDYRSIMRLRSFLIAIFVTLGAIMFLLPLQWLYFGETSLLAPLSAILLTPVCEAILWLLPQYLICSLLHLNFLTGRFAWLITALSRAAEEISSHLSRVRALVSLKYPFALPIMIILFAIILIMMIKNVRSWLASLVPFALCAAVFVGCVGIYEYERRDTPILCCAGLNHSDVFTLISDGRGYVIDISAGGSVLMTEAADLLSCDYITEIDTCIFTHLHRRHAVSLRRLCEERMVRRVLLPEPITDAERNFAADLCELGGELGVTVEFYPRPGSASIAFLTDGEPGDSIELFDYSFISRSVHPLIGIRFRLGDAEVLYAGSSLWEYPDAAGFLSGANVVILGSHGPVIKSEPDRSLFGSARVYSLAAESEAEQINGRLRIEFNS